MSRVKKYVRKEAIFILLVIALTIPLILPLFQTGFFVSDDGDWMIIRFSAFYDAVRDGQFPVRWLGRLNNSYGYPLANFMYPGYLYLGVPIHLLGFGFVHTIKIIFGASYVASSVFVYLWLRNHFNRFVSLISATLYGFAPYHLYDMYSRGSVGEILALAIVPFILWKIERKSFFWTSLGIGFLLLSHNTLALFFLPILFCYALLSQKRKQRDTKIIVVAFSLGVGSSLFFILPAVLELSHTIFRTTQISEWQNYFANITLIGILSFLAVIGSLIFIWKKKGNTRLPIFFAVHVLVTIFFSSQLSSFLWPLLPHSLVQFPFRLLSVVIIGVPFLVAYLLSQTRGYVTYGLSVCLFIIAIIQTTQFFPTRFEDRMDAWYATNQSTTTTKNEYMPKWVINHPQSMPEEKVIAKNAEVKIINQKSHLVEFMLDKSDTVVVQTVYFPGWKVKSGNEVMDAEFNDEGFITVHATANTPVTVYFGRTPIRAISELLSVFSVSLIIIFTIMRHRSIYR